MTLTELVIIAIGLSMDAFAVSIGKGLSLRSVRLRHYLLAGLWFGGFQALMPLVGYACGVSFAEAVASIDHWIAFVLLAIIGGKMVRDALSGEEESSDADFSVRTMFLLAVATSIDALAVGVSFAFLHVDLLLSVSAIGLTTFLFSAVGVQIGHLFGNRWRSHAELLGGVVLISMGLKILVEHLFFN